MTDTTQCHGVAQTTTNRYSFIDSNGRPIILVRFYTEGSSIYELHDVDYDGDGEIEDGWYCNSLVELFYVYDNSSNELGTLDHPRMRVYGIPVQIVSTVNTKGPVYKKIEYLAVEMPQRLTAVPVPKLYMVVEERTPGVEYKEGADYYCLGRIFRCVATHPEIIMTTISKIYEPYVDDPVEEEDLEPSFE